MSGWLDRVHALRNRILADPRFQRYAVTSFLLRPIARARARALFDICAGFVYSQVLLACVRLGLLEILREGPQDVAQLSGRLSLPREAAERLLAAAAELGIAARRGAGRYGLGMHGAALLANPGIARMVEHNALLYADLADPVALLRGEVAETALAGYWPYAGESAQAALDAARTRPYTELMAASQELIAGHVLDAYPMSAHRCLLDVGGGDGSFLRAVAHRWPHLRLMLLDLPSVAAVARERFEAAGLAARTSVFGGDFRADALPQGADVISLVRVLHDHDDATVMGLLCAARRALAPGGVLLVAEPMAAARGARTVGGVYFAFYLMAMGRGRARQAEELAAMMTAAGFARVRPAPTHVPLQTGLIVGHA